jgi:hypothetical protein
MCIIVDANVAALVFCEPLAHDFVPLVDWLTSPKKDGKLVIGGQLADELSAVRSVTRFIRALSQAGRARLIPAQEVVAEQERIILTGICRSDDPHVIALARVSGVRVLCSQDVKLHADFKNLELISAPKGAIYQGAKHRRLLRHAKSCQTKMGALKKP